MTALAPVRARQSYRHEAFLWRTRAEYVGHLVPFLVEGLDAGETVVVTANAEHARWLRHDLGARAAEVRFIDIDGMVRNPARLIPALLEFLEEACGPGRPARGVGEPVWAGRNPEEVAEAQLHEALLNLAVDPDLPFWLICPYDAANLPEPLLGDAGRSHPVISTPDSYLGSGSYRGRDHARELFSADLPELDVPDADLWVAEQTLDLAAEQVTLRAAAGDLRSDQVVTLNGVVRDLVVDSVRRGAERARLRLWDEPDELVCEVSDRVVVGDLLVGRRPPTRGRTDAVWSANQVCDLVQVRSNLRGTSVRLHLRK
ncbi:MEDS domain-containing protein [Microlunatus flavus]|uniref:MEDS: MEthanogen/methylotroph, DcmR Sensory domain n=1 Tax=Microlunatus flavus TaxID=1036181 RepID=A0A1H9C5V4_9ACTN|nr:MEDS domain-containing protein [Microlunatus flavus]SEP96655.1 MEDS: MEthanogen/methylotroph, DcmR Sensory domain [Microlunatus flavus]